MVARQARDAEELAELLDMLDLSTMDEPAAASPAARIPAPRPASTTERDLATALLAAVTDIIC